MDVEMGEVAQVEGRKLRRVSPRKSFTNLLSGSPLPSPASVGLSNLLNAGAPTKYPRRTPTPSPFRFALTTCKEIFQAKLLSPPPSPTRIHKPPHTAHLPSDLSIPPSPRVEHFEPAEKEYEEPQLTPFDIPVILEQIIAYLDDSNSIPSEPAPVRRKWVRRVREATWRPAILN